MRHKIIFEGAELSGKSYLMSQVYNYLEPKYNTNNKILNGCHWFNCDVGLYGTKYGKIVLEKYIELIEHLEETNIIMEKFHLTEAVYQKLYNNIDFNFNDIENRLNKKKVKIILTTYNEDIKLIKKRLKDRLDLYPHYKRIAQKPEKYIEQQKLYLKLLRKSKLDYLIINSSKLPDNNLTNKILKFIKEK